MVAINLITSRLKPSLSTCNGIDLFLLKTAKPLLQALMPKMSSTVSAGRKRKLTSATASLAKKAMNVVPAYRDSKNEERYGIVQREFYPPEMTNERCLLYANGTLPRPIEVLETAMRESEAQRERIPVKDAVVHWYKWDLRTRDNKALHLASEKAKSKGVPLICLYVVSPQDYQAHMTSPARVDFALRTLEVLKEELAALDIPLYMETVEKRKRAPDRIIELCESWGASHLYANIEYEVDELRREALMTRKCLEKGIAFNAFHDTCVVAPGELSSQQGKQYAVYSPWFRAWIAHLHSHPEILDLYDVPGKNPTGTREKYQKLFEAEIPVAPENKRLTDDEKRRFRSMWPAGEFEGQERLAKFLGAKVTKYKDARNFPASNSTAMLSVHFSAGTLSARTAVHNARAANSTNKLDGGNAGIVGWISEIAWRDFYKHVLAHWPYIWYVVSHASACQRGTPLLTFISA